MALPLAFESGTGSELRNPLGCAIVGGLLLSQLLTLYTTPVIYLYMDRLARRFRQPPRADGALVGVRGLRVLIVLSLCGHLQLAGHSSPERHAPKS